MLRFLFWNLNRKDLLGSLVSMAQYYDVDVLILAESTVTPGQILSGLNGGRRSRILFDYAPTPVPNSVMQIYCRFARRFLTPVQDSPRFTVRYLHLPLQQDILLVAAHLPSRLHFSHESISMEAVSLARRIHELETERDITRTVLVGDLNLNPFDVGVVGTEGLHAVMTQQTALRESRTVQGKQYPFFYNPMWSHFGDNADTPAGTYYQDRAEAICYFWNMFDQVLIRPSLISRWQEEK